MRKIILNIVLVLTFCNQYKGQQDFILYHMPSIPQITQVDPASFPDSKVDIGLPIISSVYGSAFNTGFAFSDILTQDANGNVMPDINGAMAKMRENNFLVLNANTDLLFLGFKKGNNFYSFNVTEKVDFTFNYPKDLIIMALEGNGNNLLGRRASFDGLGMDFTHWREYAVHWVHDVDHKFSYGARLKYLYGMENFNTQVSYMGITTDQNTHALTFDMNFEFQSAGLPLVIFDDSINAIGAIDTTQSMMTQAGFTDGNISNYLFGRQNNGVGIDLGFNYHVNDKLLLEASVLDLGFISWNQYTSNSNLSEWDYTYSGIEDAITVFGNGSSVQFLKDVLEDSIEMSLKENFTYSTPSYRTALRTKIYASMEYIVDHNNFISLTGYSSFVRNRWRRGLGLAYNFHLGNFLSATASYSIYNRSYSNVGIGVSLNAGPLEIYFLTDNVLALGTLNLLDNARTNSMNVDIEKVKNGQLHFGVNLTFGREKAEPKHKDEEEADPVEMEEKTEKQQKENSSKDQNKSNLDSSNSSSSKSTTSKKSNLNNAPANSKEKKNSSKSSKSDLNADPGKSKKDKNKKIDNTPKVEETEPRERTFRKVPKKI
ncbi:MAG: hypothetical protein CL846_08055 [Crocinitomicaceae bacterium]|nr:hypothetical protein [Crocinitomicaceae bacterium]|tara:strand:- start:2206 stop:4002 length:1797 start_codon:yes stop_codon:yes gene_type:complete